MHSIDERLGVGTLWGQARMSSIAKAAKCVLFGVAWVWAPAPEALGSANSAQTQFF